MKIYLADLTYDTLKTNYTVPLNVAYIAATLDHELGDAVSIRLFKYPTELEAALKESVPDMLGLSNYSWNHRLNFVFLDLFKRLNPEGITIMGGPHISRDQAKVELFLRQHSHLDYYVPGEGETPTLKLVQALLGGDASPAPQGCATVRNGPYQHEMDLFSVGPKELDIPSPYLSGWLDPFLKDPAMIPLFESNRGCPFKCSYCTWGNRINARVKVRSMDVVCKEIEYISKNSVGQASWNVCDANFGLLPRDIEIAKMFKKTIQKYGHPSYVDLCHSKNTTERNLEIARIMGTANTPMIGVQSTDPVVLENLGRKNIQMSGMREQLQHHHQNNVKVSTDILIGLSGETWQSHFKSLADSFEMGFDYLCPNNIRLLPGSTMEEDESREKYQIFVKYRPIFGAYGVYDGKPCFEYEEGVRGTVDMTEEELNSFKVHHLLIFMVWGSGMFRAQFRLGLKFGVNPMTIIGGLAETRHPVLRPLFDNLLAESMDEWFDDEESFVNHYSKPENFAVLQNFRRLISWYIACIISDPAAIEALRSELHALLDTELKANGFDVDQLDSNFVHEVFDFTNSLWCSDLLSDAHEERREFSGAAAAHVLDRPDLAEMEQVEVHIYRSEETVSFCRFHLAPEGIPDLSVDNIARFQELGGIRRMLYSTEILAPAQTAEQQA